MGLFGFLWDLHQQDRIRDLESRVRENSSPSTPIIEVQERLQRRIDALMLVNMAMWSLMREKLSLTEEELQARVRELDLKDGDLDGRISTPPRTCSACGRTIAAKHPKCLYCGHAEPGSDAFGGLA